ncbi:MAG: dihydroneopterin aldolase [Caldithrix sp.]|nr:dihydroneopterin aldolase [Caldithrix sp.]
MQQETGYTDTIRLKNMIFYAHHGFYEAERELGQKFEVDIEVQCDLHQPALKDQLKQTMDYRAIFNIAKKTFENYKFKLIETVAERIAEQLLQFDGIDNVRIRVRKPHVPLNGLLDYVEVEIYRTRNHKTD